MSGAFLSRVLPVPVGDEVVELSLDDLPQDIEEYVQVLREERCPAPFWLKLASECGARRRFNDCELVLNSAIHTLSNVPPTDQPYRSRQSAAEEVAPFHAMLSSFQLMNARSCPKVILSDAKYQNLRVSSPQIQSKDRLTSGAAQHSNRIVFSAPPAKGSNPRFQSPTLRCNLLLGKGIYLTITADTEEALKCFKGVLDRQPRNPLALLGTACCLLRKREYNGALSIYQDVLRISIAQEQRSAKESAIVGPDGELVENQASKWLGPDPRVGIGLCLQGLGRTSDARRAWKRAIAVNQSNAAAHLLLGLSLLNAAKQLSDLGPDLAGLAVSESEARTIAYREGLSHIEVSWKLDNKNAMTAIALAEHFCVRALATSSVDRLQAQKEYERSLKLGEHAIQYADNKAAVNQAWLIFARTAHLYSFLDETSTSTVELRSIAQRYYTRAADDLGRGMSTTSATSEANTVPPGYAMAILGLAQLQLSRGESLGAMNTMESIMTRPASSKSTCLELTLMAASLRAESHPGATPVERSNDRSRARVLLDRALRMVESCKMNDSTLKDDLREIDDMLNSNEIEPHSNLEIARVALAEEGLGKIALEQIYRLGTDELAYVQMADLLQQSKDSRSGDATRAIQSLMMALQALEIKQKARTDDSTLEEDVLAIRLQANLGALLGLKGIETHGEIGAQCFIASIDQLQKALGAAGKSLHTSSLDAEKTTALYNLARILEASGSIEDAQKAYDAVLANHPEYADAKVRQALLVVCSPSACGNRESIQLANTLFKEALTSDPLNLDTRSAFVCFLSGELPGSPNPPQWESIKENIAQLFMGASSSQAIQLFGSATAAKAVTDEARRDAYTLSALAWSYYNIGHGVKPSANAKSERLRAMLRCCDLLDKALIEDRYCAFALQGLAILLAEGSMVDMTVPNGAQVNDVEMKKRKTAEEAIGILTKLREVNEGSSVHICIGHAYMSRDDYNRALKSYELAAKREQPKPSLLQYLSRATFHLGMESKSYNLLQKSINYLKEAIVLLQERTSGSAAAEVKFLKYNIGVTRQKMMQMMFELVVENRSRQMLEEAIEGVRESQVSFKELTQDAIEGKLSYITGEIIEQRQMYGETLLRQSEKHIEEQQVYEEETREKREIAAARKREREEAIEKERLAKESMDRAKAEALAEERRKAIEEARTWDYYQNEMEEKPKKSRKSEGGGGKGKRRKGKKKRKDEEGASEIESSESEVGAAFPESEEDDDMIVSDGAEIEQGDMSDNELERKRDDVKKEARRKEKRTRKERRARKSDASRGDGSKGEGDSESEDRPAKKPKKTKMRRAVEEDLIESDEEV